MNPIHKKIVDQIMQQIGEFVMTAITAEEVKKKEEENKKEENKSSVCVIW